jgi:hypothetical protein
MFVTKRKDLSDFLLPTSKGYLELGSRYRAKWLASVTPEGFNLILFDNREKIMACSIDFNIS